MNKKRQYKTYTREFKEEAVALIAEQGYSVADAAKSLHIKTNLLYNWKNKLEQEASGSMLSPDDKAELIKLAKKTNA